ncbi:MAG: hypothetical protein HY870_17290 [Chloroflexi bacterium]|nr:hypothetical protein [Chloroflexota bacterium]
MTRLPLFFRWLSVAALVDWLIGRTFTRSAMFMPKSPLMIAVYQALGSIGQVALTLTSLLAIIAVIWIAWRERRHGLWPLLLIARVMLSLGLMFVAATGWLRVIDHALSLIIVSALLAQNWRSVAARSHKFAWSLPALALFCGVLYQLLPALAEALNLSATPAWANVIFNLGELLIVLSPIGLAWIDRAHFNRKIYLVALSPALLFTLAHFANPAMTGIIAIWSIGLTLYLPWPLYAISLWLFGAVVIGSIRHPTPIGWALLLWAASGYTPQLSTHLFVGLIAVWLMRPTHSAAETQPVVLSRQITPQVAPAV